MSFRTITLILIFGGYLFTSPYLASRNILRAANNQDVETLISYIDFPAVRDSVKDQLKNLLQMDMPSEWQRTILSAVDAPSHKLLTVEQMIDRTVSDKSLKALLANMKNDKAGLKDLLADVKMEWRSFGEFSLTVKRQREVIFILSRDRLIFWKITGTILPIRKVYLQRPPRM